MLSTYSFCERHWLGVNLLPLSGTDLPIIPSTEHFFSVVKEGQSRLLRVSLGLVAHLSGGRGGRGRPCGGRQVEFKDKGSEARFRFCCRCFFICLSSTHFVTTSFQTYTFSRNMKLMLGPRGLNSLAERNNALLLLGPSCEILKSYCSMKLLLP